MGCTPSKTDEEVKPNTVRGCTDVFWLVLFIVFWLFMIAIAVFAFVFGNPVRIINGYDSFGNTCGVESNLRFQNIPLSGQNTINKPNVFFLDVKELRQSLKICVKKCPDRKMEDVQELYRFYQDTGSQLCRYDFDMSLLQRSAPKGMDFFNMLGPCPKFTVFNSTSVLHRCVPTGEGAPGERVTEAYDLLNSWSVAQQLIGDLYTTWPYIIIMCVASLVLSIIVVGLMNWITHIISWLVCAFVALSSIAITVVLWLTYNEIHNRPDNSIKYSKLYEYVANENLIYVLAIVATIVTVGLLALIFFLRTKLTGLAALFEETSKCMFEIPTLIIPSLVAFILLGLFLAFWVAVVVCLATANSPAFQKLTTPVSNEELPALPSSTQSPPHNNVGADYKPLNLVEYRDVDLLRNMVWIYLIGLIWTGEFICACVQITLAGAVAFWYFRKPTDSPVLYSACKLIKYHLGSAAKGSILITIFKIPRLILTFLYAKMKKSADSDNGCAACGLKVCMCCFWFLEKFLRYLNHNAYTVIAIESINFCPAAGVAWNALVTNTFQVATINGIGDLILFMGKLAVSFICTFTSILLLRHREDLHFYIIPCIIIGVFSFLIAHVILTLFEMVVDTLFLCVCEDRTIHGPNGRWRETNLAHLLGEEPVDEAVMPPVEMAPINKQPFSSYA